MRLLTIIFSLIGLYNYLQIQEIQALPLDKSEPNAVQSKPDSSDEPLPNRIVAIREINNAIEIDIYSEQGFYAGDMPPILQIGERQFKSSMNIGPNLNTLRFFLSKEQFQTTKDREPVKLHYGNSPPFLDFGVLDKKTLTHETDLH